MTNISHEIRSKRPVPAGIVLIIGVLAVSTAALMIRKAQTGASSMAIAAWRLSLATIILVPFSIRRIKDDLSKLSKRQHLLAFSAGAFLALHFAFWITSLELTSIASSVVLVTTAPLWVALFSSPILGEKISRLVWIGLIIALVGGSIVGLSEVCGIDTFGISCVNENGPLLQNGQLGNLFAIAGAWCSAAYLIIGRRLRPSMDLRSYTMMIYGYAGILLLLGCLARGDTLIGFSPKTYVWLAGLAVFPQIIGHSSFNYALAYLPAALVSVALLGEPIGAIMLGYVFLHEAPSFLELVGGGLILAGLYLANKRPNRVS